MCGMSAIDANVAPPLKSTSISASRSGPWPITSDDTSVRSISDLPDPVAPTTIPCGPMPPWADSLRSSSTTPPSGPDPDRHPQQVVHDRLRQVCRASSRAGSGTPRISGSPTVSVKASPSSRGPRADSRSGDSCRASSSGSPAGTASTRYGAARDACRATPVGADLDPVVHRPPAPPVGRPAGRRGGFRGRARVTVGSGDSRPRRLP